MKTTIKSVKSIAVTVKLVEFGKQRTKTRIFQNAENAANFWLEHKCYELNHNGNSNYDKTERRINKIETKVRQIFNKHFGVEE